jgi:host factor-I protein
MGYFGPEPVRESSPFLQTRIDLCKYEYRSMKSSWSSRHRSKTPPLDETGQEALYLRSLSERQVPVFVKLRDGEKLRGWIEYFDDGMLRLTREGQPNLFIYKHQIATISEVGQRSSYRPVSAGSAAASGAVTNEAAS